MRQAAFVFLCGVLIVLGGFHYCLIHSFPVQDASPEIIADANFGHVVGLAVLGLGLCLLMLSFLMLVFMGHVPRIKRNLPNKLAL
jgi:hypothetical protein